MVMVVVDDGVVMYTVVLGVNMVVVVVVVEAELMM